MQRSCNSLDDNTQKVFASRLRQIFA